MHRRKFLQNTALLTLCSLLPLGIQGWAVRSHSQSFNPQRLVVIFLRGGVDGLSLVVPYRDRAYYEARPTIALSPPNQVEGVLDLDGEFGLHPALFDLLPLWQQGSLAFIHAAGSSDSTRSHFDAQDYMETGTPGIKTTADGWMNRLLAVLPQGSPIQAVNLGATTPRILAGSQSVVDVPTGNRARRQLPVDRPIIQEAFDRLYRGSDALSLAYQEGREAREILLRELDREMMAANRGSANALGFATEARKLAQLMVGDARTQLAFMAIGGWDTHVNQKNLLTRLLKPLGEGMATLARELGDLYNQTAIVVMSEFGRTVRENGNQGTDHGHGNVIWVLGGSIGGGQVYGNWLGLADNQLYEGRDLPVTTDFRAVLSTVLQQHLKLSAPQLATVFPGYPVNQSTANLAGLF